MSAESIHLPTKEEVDQFVVNAKAQINEENNLEIFSTYASSCSRQICDNINEKSMQKLIKKFDYISSLPNPTEIFSIYEKKMYEDNLSPIVSAATNRSHTHIVAGCFSDAIYFSINKFHMAEHKFPQNDENESTENTETKTSDSVQMFLNLPQDSAFCRCVSFHPSDVLVGITKYDKIHLYDIDKNCVISTIPAHDGCITGLSFSNDGGHMISSSYDSTIKTHDLIKSQTIYDIKLGERITALESSFDDRLVGVTTNGGNLMLFDNQQEGSCMKINVHHSWASTLTFSKYDENLMATGGSDKSVALFDIRQPMSALFRLYRHEGTPATVVFDHQNHIWSGTVIGEMQAWNLSDARRVYKQTFAPFPVYKLLIIEEQNSLYFLANYLNAEKLVLENSIFSVTNDENGFF